MNSAQLTVYTQLLSVFLYCWVPFHIRTRKTVGGECVLCRGPFHRPPPYRALLSTYLNQLLSLVPRVRCTCNPHKGVPFERTELLLRPFLIRQLEVFFFPLSVFFLFQFFSYKYIFISSNFLSFFTESERELPHDGHVWYLPNYSYIGRCFVSVHDLNLNIWSSFSVPSCITKRLPM